MILEGRMVKITSDNSDREYTELTTADLKEVIVTKC